MKPSITTFLFAFLVSLSTLHAQQSALPLPPSTLIPHYLLPVGYNTTTVLVFAAPVKPVDRGDRDIIAQKQPGAENVLKIKAARKNFPITNLHVFTEDGKIFTFDVIYTDSVSSTYNLSTLSYPVPPNGQSIILLSNEPVNTVDMQAFVDRVKDLPASHHGPVDNRNKMSIRLDNVCIAGSMMFFRFQLRNHSNIDYNMNFLRLYIRDRVKSKRTSVQEKEILPVYEDGNTTISGDSSIVHVIAVPTFTLAGGKQFIVESYEKNGGRSLTLFVRNKTILKARKL
ncbi:conjugative transposon protein TraN [Puia dinghuensis]|uniref:Conjugative transposon protein TraN n=1 Tax=Puia dinghuensis TaxID=1792502 RepID=A0A8J2UBM8_9BACT|nr:conjugative transposon protein TraN [Puia dinghuensis]GGA92899.1 conjugative transposon protein TraN [Puia dinghuensis]